MLQAEQKVEKTADDDGKKRNHFSDMEDCLFATQKSVTPNGKDLRWIHAFSMFSRDVRERLIIEGTGTRDAAGLLPKNLLILRYAQTTGQRMVIA